VRRARAYRGRAGGWQDDAGARAGDFAWVDVSPPAMHAGSDAQRRDRRVGLPSARCVVRVPAGSDLYQHSAGGRDQSCNTAHAERPARSDGRRAGDCGWNHVCAATPFLVLATQNPVEFEGTFPLPEAQLDRFFVEVAPGYPSPEEEAEMLRMLAGEHPIETLKPVVDGQQIPALQRAIWSVHVDDAVRNYIIRLAHATRAHPDLALGASPRATLALFRASQALAALRGRDYVLPDDVKYLVRPVWRHRLLARPESALRGRTAAAALDAVLAEVDVGIGQI